MAYMTQCPYGIHGIVTDRVTGQPSTPPSPSRGHDDEYSFVKSHLPSGDYHRPIKGGTYHVIISKNGYYPQTHTITVADGETVNFDVQLDAGQGLIPDFNASYRQVALGRPASTSPTTHLAPIWPVGNGPSKAASQPLHRCRTPLSPTTKPAFSTSP